MFKNKKGVLEAPLNAVIYVAIIFVVIILLLAIITPTIFERSTDLYDAGSHEFNFTNASAVNMPGDVCVASTLTCINTTGTETVASGNYTFTTSTCSILGVNGTEYQDENVTCSYSWETGSFGNVTTGIENISVESVNLIPVAFGVIVLIIIFLAIIIFRRQAK